MLRDSIPKISRIIYMVLLAACIAGALFYSIMEVSKFPKWVVDDAFINFRYAEHLAAGNGPTWNPGTDPVEGYTGVAIVWLLSVTERMGIPPITAAHFFGIFFYYFGAVALMLAFRGVTLSSAVVLVLYLTAPFFYPHAWSGLETTMFTSLIIFSIYNFVARNQRLFIASILILSLTRPEGILLSVILLALFRPISLPLVLMYAVPFSIYFIWRWSYYGQLLPNTFYAKFSVDSEENTFSNLKRFFSLHLQLPALLAFIAFTWERVRGAWKLTAGLALFTAACLWVYLSSNLVMNYAYRFFVPFYVLFLLALGGLLKRSGRDAKLLALCVLLVTPQVNKNINKKLLTNYSQYARTYYKMLQEEHIAIGRFLRENLPGNEWLVVHSDAGAIPYYSGLPTVDCGRLNDEYLSREKPTPEQMADYVYSHDPGAMVFTSSNSRIVRHGDSADKLLRDKRIDNYRLVDVYSSKHRRKYFEFLYLREDIADSLGLKQHESADIRPTSSASNQTPSSHVQTYREKKISAGLSLGSQKREKGGTGYSPDWKVPRARDLDEDLDNSDGLWEFAVHEKDRKIKRTALEKFLREYSEDPRVPEALWELSSVMDDPQERIEKLKTICDEYPDHSAAPKALFTMGFIYSEELKEPEEAKACFKKLLEKYPDTEPAQAAKWMLDNLEAPPPDME